MVVVSCWAAARVSGRPFEGFELRVRTCVLPRGVRVRRLPGRNMGRSGSITTRSYACAPAQGTEGRVLGRGVVESIQGGWNVCLVVRAKRVGLRAVPRCSMTWPEGFLSSALLLLLLCRRPIPRNTLVQRDALAPKDIQRATNGHVDSPAAELLHQLQVGEVARATGVGDGDGVDAAQRCDEGGVDAGLEAFGVGGVDQEGGAVG